MKSESRSVVSNSLRPHDCTVHEILQAEHSLSLLHKDLPNTGTEPRSPTLQADSLTAEPQGKQSINSSCFELFTSTDKILKTYYLQSLILL